MGQFDQYQTLLSKTVGELRLLRHRRTGRFKRRSLKDLKLWENRKEKYRE